MDQKIKPGFGAYKKPVLQHLVNLSQNLLAKALSFKAYAIHRDIDKGGT